MGNESGFAGGAVGFESSKNARVNVERPGQDGKNDMGDVTGAGKTVDTLYHEVGDAGRGSSDGGRCKDGPVVCGSKRWTDTTTRREPMGLALTILTLVLITNILQWTGHAFILDTVRSSYSVLHRAVTHRPGIRSLDAYLPRTTLEGTRSLKTTSPYN